LALTPGTRLGPYEIVAAIGSGGMGEVYRATDSNLKRSVAIKVLAAAVAGDADRLARFQREAEVLAALNHPSIAAIYGLEKTPHLTALAMELVEGEDLSDIIRRNFELRRSNVGVLEWALPIAKQIADALEAAHEQGIIHRDLKPQNIKVRADGTVKVLDFGLAKAVDSAGTLSADAMSSPTLSARATQEGMVIGTAAYMAPEQARGKAVDKRADIWAFGAVLYEMLTGRRAFEGDDVSTTLAAVLKDDVKWAALPADMPVALRRLLERCLERDPKQRLQAIGEARIALQEIASGAAIGPLAPSSPNGSAPSTGRPWMAVAALTTLVALALALPAWRYWRAPVPEEIRLDITTPSTSAPSDLVLSPDGRAIAFVASGDGPQRLWVRALDQTDARPIADTDNARYPFWSPDGRSLGFFAGGKLYRVDLGGGLPQALAPAPVPRGGAWSPDGIILFAPTSQPGPLMKIAAAGGTPVPVPVVAGPRNLFPVFLPDGRRFLEVAATYDSSAVYLGSLDGEPPVRLTDARLPAAYLPSGVLLFRRQSALVAQHLDVSRGTLSGDVITLADLGGGGATATGGDPGGFSVSTGGRIAYRGGSGLRQIRWIDRTGKPVGAAVLADGSRLSYPEIFADGRRMLLSRAVDGNGDVWIADLTRGGLTRFTFDPSDDCCPVASPDGLTIVFAASRSGVPTLWTKPSNGVGVEQAVLATPNPTFPRDWSHDGRFLLYSEQDPKTGVDLWALPMTGTDKTPVPIARMSCDESNGQFSPDDHFVAYETNESGPFEIVVQTFPQPAGRWQVSLHGGTQPRWRADGKELYFIGADGTMMAAPVTLGASTFSAGTPVPLFPSHVVPGGGANRPNYTVGRDGRFLINQPVESASAPITLILNWRPR
jgi:serine/threonine protein kinase/Tol biopolymer transport system component